MAGPRADAAARVQPPPGAMSRCLNMPALYHWRPRCRRPVSVDRRLCAPTFRWVCPCQHERLWSSRPRKTSGGLTECRVRIRFLPECLFRSRERLLRVYSVEKLENLRMLNFRPKPFALKVPCTTRAYANQRLSVEISINPRGPLGSQRVGIVYGPEIFPSALKLEFFNRIGR